jgi:hypothetical protein
MNNIRKALSIIPLSIISFSILGCVSSSSSQSKGLALSSSVKSNSTLFSKNTNHIKKQALLLGISDYAGDNADLGGIERDVEKMGKLFKSWGFDVKVLYDKDSMNIINYLDSYATGLGSNDYFAFYYSGHGSHTADKNNDESDGEDETLVLSDGKDNTHLIDDILYAKFNAIKAKKMIFFDSCHSGTVFRKLNGKSQPKTMSPNDVKKTFSKGLSVSAKSDNISSDSEYIVFSSSQDHEESLATPTGSLFTNSLYEIFSDKNSYNESFEDIGKTLTKKVLTYAKKSDGTPHHPSISFSKSYSNSSTFKEFIETKSTEATVSPTMIKLPSSTTNSKDKDKTLQDTLDNLINSRQINKMSLNYNRTSYKSGESIKFSLDTKGERGYLTLFYIDSNEVTLLYPNPFVSSKKIQGNYTFPDDFSNGKFELEAYKSCNNCQEENTVIYTLLSSKPILDASAIKSRDGLNSFAKGSSESKIITRAVRIKTKKSISEPFKPQLNKYNFIVK